MPVTLNVSQLNMYIKSLVDGDLNLSQVFVTGEISNFTNHYRTGHLYFSLKDENAAVKAVMFRSAASRLKFLPENGMKVIVRGSVGVYERDGVYQIYVEDMQPDGAGALNLAFEQLKRKLEKKGYFDAESKKPLPQYPEKIAVVTSPTGAAVRDIFNVLSRRFPYAGVVLVPVQVQGDSAAGQIARAIREINKAHCADVIIAGRGGGSIEDLWAFNDEDVANAIFESDIPVISAVGHETDFTIADFVADMRAPTPSAAAELAVPDTNSLLTYIDGCAGAARARISEIIGECETRLLGKQKLLSALSVEKFVSDAEKRLESLKVSATAEYEKIISGYSERLCALCAAADALNPMKIITRGYAVVRGEDGEIIKSVANVNAGDKAVITLRDGFMDCTVERIRTDGKE
ncbi:MAG: exodeoxyribonuclease VII large subunit [Clostridia bacterium]|nr:exodeoxyribonuclease VII large subunit [Clostridia bacterium]